MLTAQKEERSTISMEIPEKMITAIFLIFFQTFVVSS